MTKNPSFSCFMAVFMSYCPLFWGSTGFAWHVRPDTCLRDLTKNTSFSHFMAVFMSYCPRFWGSRGICMACTTRFMFEIYDKKLVVFLFYGRFHELLPMVLASKAI